MKIYVGCAITTVPEDKADEFVALINSVKNSIRDSGHEVLEFRTALFPDATDEEVYIHDIHDCVGTADAMLAICDHSSIGLGYELATAIEKRGIPVVAVAHKDIKISKLVLGISHPKFVFERYDTAEDIVPILLKHI